MKKVSNGKRQIYDRATKEWFDARPKAYQTTVQLCESCGLFYKPSLGHKCRKEK